MNQWVIFLMGCFFVVVSLGLSSYLRVDIAEFDIHDKNNIDGNIQTLKNKAALATLANTLALACFVWFGILMRTI